MGVNKTLIPTSTNKISTDNHADNLIEKMEYGNLKFSAKFYEYEPGGL
jgi:hypothetical protein